jgi:hypothetical protein
VFIFIWLFLDFAQKIQLIAAPRRLINTSTVSPFQVLLTDLICALFSLTYTACYAWLSRPSRPTRDAAKSAADSQQPLAPFGLALAIALCVPIGLVIAPSTYHIEYTDDMPTSPLSALVRNVLVFMPSATLLIVLHETVSRRIKWTFSRASTLLLLFVMVLLSKNTLTDTRFSLGSVYLSILLVGFGTYFRSQNRRILLLTLGMVLVFPFSALFTHHMDVTLDAIVQTIEYHYFEPHYDSWANVYSSVELVRRQGIEWGHQLLGTLLFFVPRSIWPTKPVHTGVFIANYLIANYHMWFTNLSGPLVAEGYIDFGPLGSASYACALAILVARLNRLASITRKWLYVPLATYLSMYLMFALRGPLMSALAYGLGTTCSFLLASTLLHVGSRKRRAESAPSSAETETLPEIALPATPVPGAGQRHAARSHPSV